MSTPIPAWVFVASILLAMLGTTLAGSTLSRMSEADFRRYSRLIIQTVSIVMLMRGLWLLVSG
jgi:uncharacterized membrane protein YfcA